VRQRLSAKQVATDTSPDIQGCIVLRAYGISEQGRIRSGNEDHFAIDERLRLCVVADGLGGHNAGEVAARLAVDTVVEFIRDTVDGVGPFEPGTWPFGYDPDVSDAGNLLRTAIHLANMRLLETADTAVEYGGMGTTIVAALVAEGRLSVGHVGDSRLYLFARARLRQLTSDDSWAAKRLVEEPGLDPLVLQHHPMQNALTNVVGRRPRTDVHIAEEPLAGGELLLLSTDGVHGVIDERRLKELLAGEDDPADVAGRLVSAALTRGSRDNCTAVVARYFPG
jgi:serine/threonine protein phosphatase PrpC